MSDSRSRAADAEEELEAYLAEHPHPYPVGTEVMRVSPYTGSAVKVTRAGTNRHSAGKYRHTVHLEGGALEWPVKDFEPVPPTQPVAPECGAPATTFSPGDRVKHKHQALEFSGVVARCFWHSGYIMAELEDGREVTAAQWKLQPGDLAESAQSLSAQAQTIARLKLELNEVTEANRELRIELEDLQGEPRDLAETEHPESMGCAVVQPDHYNRPGAPNCGDLIRAMELPWDLANVVKYVYRAGIKTPVPLRDLRKARQSLDLEISRLEQVWEGWDDETTWHEHAMALLEEEHCPDDPTPVCSYCNGE